MCNSIGDQKKDKLSHLEERHNHLGFPGCVGEVDCMKMKSKTCHHHRKGQFHNAREDHLETGHGEKWDDHEMYIWNFFDGRCGTNNGKTIVVMPPLFTDILSV